MNPDLAGISASGYAPNCNFYMLILTQEKKLLKFYYKIFIMNRSSQMRSEYLKWRQKGWGVGRVKPDESSDAVSEGRKESSEPIVAEGQAATLLEPIEGEF